MFDLVVNMPFSQRREDGSITERRAGDHITDEAEVDELLRGDNPHQLVKIPTTRIAEAFEPSKHLGPASAALVSGSKSAS